MNKSKVIGAAVLLVFLGGTFYGAAYWGQRHALRSQSIVDALFLKSIQQHSRCLAARDWECTARTNRSTADLAAIRWRIASDQSLVDESAQAMVDEFLAWHESLEPLNFASNSEEQEDARANPSDGHSPSIADAIRPAPYFVNGQLVGYRVYPGPDRALFASLGFRAGDLIVEIDGQPMNDPVLAFESFKKLDSGKPVVVTLDKDGRLEPFEIRANWLDSQ